jgi:hypothetical protein
LGALRNVTAEEVTFCNLVNACVGSQGYSSLDLRLDPGGQHYLLSVHRLGDPEHMNKVFTVFSDDLQASVRSSQLPAGLRKDLQHESGYEPMPLDIVRQLTPEDEELAAKREELAQLEAELADRELALASLKAELAAFEGLYLRRVGVLYAELDEWNARLAELRARQAGTPEAKTEAADARSHAEESYSAAHGEAAKVQPFTPSPVSVS